MDQETYEEQLPQTIWDIARGWLSAGPWVIQVHLSWAIFLDLEQDLVSRVTNK